MASENFIMATIVHVSILVVSIFIQQTQMFNHAYLIPIHSSHIKTILIMVPKIAEVRTTITSSIVAQMRQVRNLLEIMQRAYVDEVLA